MDLFAEENEKALKQDTMELAQKVEFEKLEDARAQAETAAEFEGIEVSGPPTGVFMAAAKVAEETPNTPPKSFTNHTMAEAVGVGTTVTKEAVLEMQAANPKFFKTPPMPTASEVIKETVEKQVDATKAPDTIPNTIPVHPAVDKMLHEEHVMENASPAVFIKKLDGDKVRFIAAKPKHERTVEWDRPERLRGEWKALPAECGSGIYVPCIYLDLRSRKVAGFIVKTTEEIHLWKNLDNLTEET